MSELTNYIQCQIRKPEGFSSDEYDYGWNAALQAVLSKLEEQQLHYEFRESPTSLLKTLCIACPDNVDKITVSTSKTLYTIDNLQELGNK